MVACMVSSFIFLGSSSCYGYFLFFFILCSSLPHLYLFLLYLQLAHLVESACNLGDTGDAGLIPGSGRSPGGGNGNPVQYA